MPEIEQFTKPSLNTLSHTTLGPNTKKINNEINHAYGNDENNWGDLPIFFDGFINFGYWKNVTLSAPLLVPRDRRDSSADLYRYILNLLKLKATDKIVELGCGRGVGMIDSFTCNGKQQLVGIDVTEAQINRAKKYAKQAPTDTKCMQFITTDATDLPLEDNSIDKIYSVEVLQHINDFPSLAKEIKRVLKPDGIFAFVAHLSKNQATQDTLTNQQLLISSIEILENTDSIKSEFKKHNLVTNCHSIGEEVFPGYQKWVEQVNPGDYETNKIFKAYNEDLIDYFACVVSFE